MNDFRPLGAPIRAPEPAPARDEYERKTAHGINVWKNKRTGMIQTDPPPVPCAPAKQPLEHMVDTIQKSRQQQEEDGFPVQEYGGF